MGTKDGIYQITGIDAESFPVSRKVKPYGIVEGSVSYDKNHVVAYAMTEKGFVSLSSEITELTYEHVAMADYATGVTTVRHENGIKKLIGVFQGGTVSDMQSDEYAASEITRKGDAM